jgi:hypothetical protein
VSSESPASRLQALADFAAPWSVWIAATLRLPDHLEEGELTADELAERAGANPDALARLLHYLVAVGVLGEPSAGRFANTELSRLLFDDHGWRPWLDLDGAPGIWAESWTWLLEAVRTGSPGGRDSRWYHAEVATSGRGPSYDALMAAQVRANAERLAEVYDWSGVEQVVDVGGGTGTLLRTLLDAHSHLHGVLFELPQVTPGDLGVRGRFVAGNYLSDPLPEADVYVLSQILHSWADDGAAMILRRCSTAGGDGARILVVEGGAGSGDEASAAAASFDLFMLACTGGRERSVADFERLSATVGLAVLDVQPLSASRLVVLA